jgi:hypothetical protein
MTFAEIVLIAAGVAGIYFLLRPLQRWLERYFVRKLARPPRGHLPTIDVTDFRSRRSHQKEQEEHDHDSRIS